MSKIFGSNPVKVRTGIHLLGGQRLVFNPWRTLDGSTYVPDPPLIPYNVEAKSNLGFSFGAESNTEIENYAKSNVGFSFGAVANLSLDIQLYDAVIIDTNLGVSNQVFIDGFQTLGKSLHIDWGDGSEVTSLTNNLFDYLLITETHTYSTPGVYKIRLGGSCRTWSVRAIDPNPIQGANRTSCIVTQIISLATDRNDFANADGMFMHSQISSIPTNLFSGTTIIGSNGYGGGLSYAFWNCKNLNSIPLGFFNFNYINGLFGKFELRKCFEGCTALVGDVPSPYPWNNTDFDGLYCFKDCTQLNQYATMPWAWKGN